MEQNMAYAGTPQISLRESVSWSYKEVDRRRKRFLAPSLKTFTAYTRPLLLKQGKGQYLWDEEGKRYLDCLSQNLTISVGYNHPLVKEAVFEQFEDLQHCTTMFYNPVPGHYAEELISNLPASKDWVIHFVNSGAEAIDLAILLARVSTGIFDLICLRNSYHGLHFTAMGATGMQICRQPVPSSPGFVHAPNPDQYRGIFGAEVAPYVEELENVIRTSTSGLVAGFLAEPIQGYTGVVPLPRAYLAAVVEKVRAAGGLFIADEVQTGFARTGSNFWGFQYYDVVPDIVVMGKGIANGFPLSAVAVQRDIAEAMCDRKFFNTYAASPVGCAAGRAVLRVLEDEGLQENAATVGAFMLDGLSALQSKHEALGDVRGRGLMIGLEIVSDRSNKKPGTELAIRLHDLTKEHGLLIGRAGVAGNVMRVCPPLCINREDAEFFLDVLDRSLSSL